MIHNNYITRLKMNSQACYMLKWFSALDNTYFDDIDAINQFNTYFDYIDAINQLNNLGKKQEKEIDRLKSEVEDFQEKTRSAQNALDSSYK